MAHQYTKPRPRSSDGANNAGAWRSQKRCPRLGGIQTCASTDHSIQTLTRIEARHYVARGGAVMTATRRQVLAAASGAAVAAVAAPGIAQANTSHPNNWV